MLIGTKETARRSQVVTGEDGRRRYVGPIVEGMRVIMGDPPHGLALFFQGWASQWHPSPFEVDGVFYTCAEQYMMAEKARLFDDDTALKAILATSDPREQKALGRKVRGFNEHTWQDACLEIVRRGNMAKFTQDDELWAKLDSTEHLIIAEASPYDRYWGIGLAIDHPSVGMISKWRGENWLGAMLGRVRCDIRDMKAGRPPVC